MFGSHLYSYLYLYLYLYMFFRGFGTYKVFGPHLSVQVAGTSKQHQLITSRKKHQRVDMNLSREQTKNQPNKGKCDKYVLQSDQPIRP